MRLPSLDRVVATAGRAARRFPLVLLCALLSAVAGMWLVDSPDDRDLLERLLYVATLGLPLFVGIKLLAERRGWSGGRLLAARLTGVGLLVAIFVTRAGWSNPVAVLRYLQLSAGFHLFVAFAAYLGGGELNGFWQYNRSLLLRFLTAAVFSAVLFFGLAGALAAVDNLLGIDIEGETYTRLWFAIAFVFNTWFFLGGVPDDLAELDRRTDYPAVIKVFSQFILTPIVTVYLLILTIYLGKIIVTRVWPSGWIGYLVSSVAAVGIFSLLLVHPIEEREENRWIRTYARWFYVGLIPSIVMLLLAIWKRIDQYGITEKRYFLVVLSVWLAGISLFFIFRRSRNIKIIPVTLCVVALFTLGGPWGAYSISRRSQTARLEGLLAANGMLADGRVQPASAPVSFDDRKEMSAVVRYLAETHGTASIDPLFEGRLAEIDTVARGFGPSDRRKADLRAELILGSLDVRYVGRWAGEETESFNLFVSTDAEAIPVGGYDFALRSVGTPADSATVEGRKVVFEVDTARTTLVMRRDAKPLIEVPLTPVIRRALEFRRTAAGRPQLPQDVLFAEAENDRVRLAVFLRSVRGTVESPDEAGEEETVPESYRISSLSADCYWAEKEEVPAEPDS